MKEFISKIITSGLVIKDFKSTKNFHPVLLVEFMRDLIFKKVMVQSFAKLINLKK